MVCITIVHLMDLVSYPPVLNLVENLLSNGYYVNLVSYGIEKAPQQLICDANLRTYEIPSSKKKGLIGKLLREYCRRHYSCMIVKKLMKNSDILWTTTDISVRCLGNLVLKYKHVMQLMELEEWYPYIVGLPFPKFNLAKYAREAWKTVVPEINRAYIQKTWWDIKKTPYVLPNKPYSIKLPDVLSEETKKAIEKISREKRKIVLFLGNIAGDRDIGDFAKAIKKLGNDYCIYVAGKIVSTEISNFEKLRKKYNNVEYLGYLKAPEHLSLLQYAHIGILPYYPNDKHPFISPLNIQYCAPNKLFEHCAFGIPMIGTDVMGLRIPFEQNKIGVCCSQLDEKNIVDAIQNIELHYDEMRNNCLNYFNSVDLNSILKKILEE